MDHLPINKNKNNRLHKIILGTFNWAKISLIIWLLRLECLRSHRNRIRRRLKQKRKIKSRVEMRATERYLNFWTNGLVLRYLIVFD